MVLHARKIREKTFRETAYSVSLSFVIVFLVISSNLLVAGCTVKFGPGNPVCGNGIVDGDEVCDGEDLRGETCESLGLGGGILACRADCTGFDASLCTKAPECGNNIKEAGEACDGTDLGGETCESLGLGDGVLACRADCTGFYTNECTAAPVCGNNIREVSEVCDGTDLGGETCESQGFSGGGELACLPDCTGYDTAGCEFSPCPEGWVYIPAGDFEMGCNGGELCWAGRNNETPRHTVTLSAYCMQRTQVSVAQYRACKDAGGCTGTPTETSSNTWCNWSSSDLGQEDHPINCINWAEARQYCEWAGGNLPTEAQWEKAARGTDGRTFPWGENPPSCDLCNLNYSGEGSPWGCNDAEAGPGTWPVGYLTSMDGDSPYGLKDMAGNVWEWTLDCYDAGFYESCVDNCVDPSNNIDNCSEGRVARGGSFSNADHIFFRVVYRHRLDQEDRHNARGFRCAATPSE